MLNYRGRTYASLSSNSTYHPIVTCINWSFNSNHHTKEDELKSILREYKTIYRPIYRRLFNEVPIELLKDFMSKHNISKKSLNYTYSKFTSSTKTYINPLNI